MTTSTRGLGKSVPTGVRPYERVAGTWQAQLQVCLHGSGLTKTARQLLLAWAGKEAEAGRAQRLTPPQGSRLVDCHRRTAERAMTDLVQGGWIRLVTAGSRTHRLASDYELVRERLPRFGDHVCRKRTSEAARRVRGEDQVSLKSAANRRPPESLRTLKISKPFSPSPIASKEKRKVAPQPLPAEVSATPSEMTAVIESISQDLRGIGFAEGPLKALVEQIAAGAVNAQQVQSLLAACLYRWQRQEPRSRAKFFSRACSDANMARDLLRTLPRNAIVAPTADESAHLAHLAPALRGQPKFIGDYLKWQRCLTAAPNPEAPGYLDWFDESRRLHRVVVEHAERALGIRAMELRHQIKARLQRESSSLKENSDIWDRVFWHHFSMLALAECGLQSPKESAHSVKLVYS